MYCNSGNATHDIPNIVFCIKLETSTKEEHCNWMAGLKTTKDSRSQVGKCGKTTLLLKHHQ